jgi:hypothetical protein
MIIYFLIIEKTTFVKIDFSVYSVITIIDSCPLQLIGRNFVKKGALFSVFCSYRSWLFSFNMRFSLVRFSFRTICMEIRSVFV